MRTDMLGELDREARHAAGAALDQDLLAALQFQRRFDGGDCGQAGQRHRGGVNMGEAVRLPGDDRGCYRDLFGVGALPSGFEHAEHGVADFQVIDAGAQRGDRSGKVPAQHQGKFSLGILPGPHFPVGAVDACRRHVDDDLAWSGDGVRQIAVLQDFRTAKSLDESRFHRYFLLGADSFSRTSPRSARV